MSEEIGQKVWHVEITKATEPKSYRPNGIFVSEYEIIGISQHKICINDDWFKTFSVVKDGRRKERYNSYLNDINVSIRTNDNLLGNGVFANLYTTKKPTKRTVDKMIAECCVKIDKDFGWLLSSAKEELYDMADSFKLNIEQP